MSDDRFAELSKEDQRRYMAQALGCNPNSPGGWPNSIIDKLVNIRLAKGSKAYYQELGYFLSLN